MVQEVKKVKEENGGRPFLPFEERKVKAYVYIKRKYHKEFQERINEQAKPFR